MGPVYTSEVDLLTASWTRAMRARNLAPRTVRTYSDSLAQLAAFARASGLAELDRVAVQSFLAELAASYAAASVSVRYRALQQFFRWLEDEEGYANPMAGLKPPIVPEQPVPVLSEDDMRTLLRSCAGKGFKDRRDAAIIWLFYDTGMRLAELAGLTLADLDMEYDIATVIGKGRRRRACPFGKKTAQALDRYLRIPRPPPVRRPSGPMAR